MGPVRPCQSASGKIAWRPLSLARRRLRMAQRTLAALCAALAAALAAPGLPATRAPAPAPAPANHTYGRCELARELVGRLHVPKEEVATWVCIAFHESRFDTSAVGRLSGQSLDHGLFQISDLYWCGVRGPGGGCGVACEALRDSNIADDVQCARLIHSEHTRYTGDGFDAWAVYTRGDCTPAKRQVFVEGCFPADAPPAPAPARAPTTREPRAHALPESTRRPPLTPPALTAAPAAGRPPAAGLAQGRRAARAARPRSPARGAACSA